MPSADQLGSHADEAFGDRRRRQLRERPRRRWLLLLVGLAALTVTGAIVGGPQSFADLSADAERSVDKGSTRFEQGGSVCPGYAPTLTPSVRPREVPDGHLLVFLTTAGWHLHLAEDLLVGGARIELRSSGGSLRPYDRAPQPFESDADGRDEAVVTTTPPPADRPVLTVSCNAASVIVRVVDANGIPLPADTILLASGDTTGANPTTFARSEP